MPLFDDPPLHDFPDRAIRRLLEEPRNLRDLIAAVLPDLVGRFDFDRLERPPRTFLLDDWRRRESDMLFRLPFRVEEGLQPALVCLLVEHQSEPDPPMPLRVLVYAALYWEQEWKAWEAGHEASRALRLSPVIPIVFHTGPTPWRTHRSLAELIGGPQDLRIYAPEWRLLFLDVAERTPAEWLQSAWDWLATMAVVRAEREEAEVFRTVFAAVLQRLESLSETERVRWHDLLWFVLSWGLRRRPSEEQESLFEAAQVSQTDIRRREEVQKMSQTVQKTWEQEMLEQGVARGQIREARNMLRLLLEEGFGSLPEALVTRIEQTENLDQLRAAARQVFRLTALEDLHL